MVAWAARRYAETVMPLIATELGEFDLLLDDGIQAEIQRDMENQIKLVKEGARALALQVAQDTLYGSCAQSQTALLPSSPEGCPADPNQTRPAGQPFPFPVEFAA